MAHDIYQNCKMEQDSLVFVSVAGEEKRRIFVWSIPCICGALSSCVVSSLDMSCSLSSQVLRRSSQRSRSSFLFLIAWLPKKALEQPKTRHAPLWHQYLAIERYSSLGDDLSWYYSLAWIARARERVRKRPAIRKTVNAIPLWQV